MRMLVPPPRGEVASADPPRFAIVIPAFNAQATVAAAVESALAQTLPAEAVIVVDDGSTDATPEALQAFEGRVTLVRQENGGAASARNTGVRAARSDFVAFLDADDLYHPRRLEGLAALGTERPDLDILTTDTLFVSDGKPVGRFHETNPFPVADQRSAILATCFTFGCPAVRRSRLLDVGGFDEELRTGEDWDCIIRLILSGSSAGAVDEPWLEYHLHPGSLTSHRVEALWNRVRILEKVAESDELEGDEPAALERSLVHNRTRAAFAEAEGGIGLRRAIALAAQHGLKARSRFQLAVAGLAPSLAERWIPKDSGPLSGRFSA
jgi:Glycosyl transferase family 2